MFPNKNPIRRTSTLQPKSAQKVQNRGVADNEILKISKIRTIQSVTVEEEDNEDSENKIISIESTSQKLGNIFSKESVGIDTQNLTSEKGEVFVNLKPVREGLNIQSEESSENEILKLPLPKESQDDTTPKFDANSPNFLEH